MLKNIPVGFRKTERHLFNSLLFVTAGVFFVLFSRLMSRSRITLLVLFCLFCALFVLYQFVLGKRITLQIAVPYMLLGLVLAIILFSRSIIPVF